MLKSNKRATSGLLTKFRISICLQPIAYIVMGGWQSQGFLHLPRKPDSWLVLKLLSPLKSPGKDKNSLLSVPPPQHYVQVNLDMQNLYVKKKLRKFKSLWDC